MENGTLDKNVKGYNVGSLSNATIKSGYSGWRNIGSGVNVSPVKPVPHIQIKNAEIEAVDVDSYFDKRTVDIKRTTEQAIAVLNGFSSGITSVFDWLFDPSNSGADQIQTFRSTWFGVENEAGSAFLDIIFSAFEKGTGDSAKDVSKDRAKDFKGFDKINDKYKQGKVGSLGAYSQSLNKGIQDRYADNSHFNKDYSFGKKDRLGSVNIISASAKAEASLVQGNYSASGEWGEFDASFKAGYASASASVGIGPTHAILEAGVEVGTAKGSASYQSPALNIGGYEVVSAGTSGSLTVGEASAKAKVGINWDNGFEAGAQLKAEAVAFKATGSANVDLLGVKGTIEGSVKFGVGAKLDVGVMDGKINFNVGVSVGLGFEIGASIDASSAIGKIYQAGKEASNSGSFVEGVGTFFKSLFNSYKADTTPKETVTSGGVSFLNTSASAGPVSVSGSTSAGGDRTVTRTNAVGNTSTTVNGKPVG